MNIDPLKQKIAEYESQILQGNELSLPDKKELGGLLLQNKVGSLIKKVFSEEECLKEVDGHIQNLKQKQVDAFLGSLSPVDNRATDHFKKVILKEGFSSFIKKYEKQPIFQKAVQISLQNASVWVKQYSEAQLLAKMNLQIENLFALADIPIKIDPTHLAELPFLGKEGEKLLQQLSTCLEKCTQQVNSKNINALKEKVEEIKKHLSKMSPAEDQLKSGARLFSLQMSSDVKEQEKIRFMMTKMEGSDVKRYLEAARTVPFFQEAVHILKELYHRSPVSYQEVGDAHKRLLQLFQEIEKRAGIDGKESAGERREKLEKLVEKGDFSKAASNFMKTGKPETLVEISKGLQQEIKTESPEKRAKEKRDTSPVKIKHIHSQSRLFEAERDSIGKIEKGQLPQTPKEIGVHIVAHIETAKDDGTYVKKGRSGALEAMMWDVGMILGIEDTLVPTKLTRMDPKRDLKSEALTIDLSDKNAYPSSIQPAEKGLLVSDIVGHQQRLADKIRFEKNNVTTLEKAFAILKSQNKDTSEVEKKLKLGREKLEEVMKAEKPYTAPSRIQVGRGVVDTLILGAFDLHPANALIDEKGNVKVFDNARALPHGDIIVFRGSDIIPSYRTGLLVLEESSQPLSSVEKKELLERIREAKSRMGRLRSYFNSSAGLSKLAKMPQEREVSSTDQLWFREKEALDAMEARMNRMMDGLRSGKVTNLRDLAFAAVPDLKLFGVLNLLLDKETNNLRYYVKKEHLNIRDTLTLVDAIGDPPPLSYKGSGGMEWLLWNADQRGIDIEPLIKIGRNPQLSFEQMVQQGAEYMLRSLKQPTPSDQLAAMQEHNLAVVQKAVEAARPDWKEVDAEVKK